MMVVGGLLGRAVVVNLGDEVEEEIFRGFLD
jgi:hypothetical protein